MYRTFVIISLILSVLIAVFFGQGDADVGAIFGIIFFVISQICGAVVFSVHDFLARI